MAPKRHPTAGRRLDLGKTLRDLATIECELLELGKGSKVAKAVMSLHELSLVISGAKVDRPSPVGD
jgi:hypothetical protein